jgi:hypothetical protein
MQGLWKVGGEKKELKKWRVFSFLGCLIFCSLRIIQDSEILSAHEFTYLERITFGFLLLSNENVS